MVSVEDLDPPEEAKIKSEPKGVPHGAPPKEELAERASEWGETSADKLPDDHEETYGEAADHAYAYNRAKAHFRRFSNGLHTIMAVRIFNRPRKSENMAAPSADYLMSVPELAHKTMDAPSPYEVGSGIYVNPGAAASSAESATELRSASTGPTCPTHARRRGHRYIYLSATSILIDRALRVSRQAALRTCTAVRGLNTFRIRSETRLKRPEKPGSKTVKANRNMGPLWPGMTRLSQLKSLSLESSSC